MKKPKAELPARAGRRYSYASAQTEVLRFVQLLKATGIELAPNSGLERMVYGVLESKYQVDGVAPQSETVQEFRDRVRDLIACSEMAVTINRVRDHAQFKQLREHLRIWASTAEPNFAKPADVLDRGANGVLELLVAALTLRMSPKVLLEDPVYSAGGTNPDVLTPISGKQWGFACKTAQRTDPANLPANIWALVCDGVRQINNSPADVGVVVVSLRNVLDYEAIWNADGLLIPDQVARLGDGASAAAELLRQCDWLAQVVARLPSDDEIQSLFEKPNKALPGVLYISHGVGQPRRDGGPRDPVSARAMIYGVIGRKPRYNDYQVIQRLNNHWQKAIPSYITVEKQRKG